MAGNVGYPGSATALARIFVARWPTGAKLFVILSVALLPLALIAVFATLQTTRIADTESRAGLRLASSESSRAMAIELIGDMTALHAAVDALELDPRNGPSCARAQGVFAQQSTTGTRFVIFNRRGQTVCGMPFPGARDVAMQAKHAIVFARLLPGRGLLLGIASNRHGMFGAAFFPTEFLAHLSRPSGAIQPYQLSLVKGNERLVIDDLPRESALERRSGSRTDLGIAGLALEMEMRRTPITSSLVIALLLPLLMWAAAAGISWFVVDRLLVRPLRRLRTDIAALHPGEELDPAILRTLHAQEIRELGDTFRALTRTVALHEAGLAEGLVRQTRLTREVHHRVKNNLQVISSLINLHARSARTPEVTQAYASIQRRVDALAVVHRHHFAELEENRGLGLRPVISELATSIRATAPEGSRLGLALDLDPFFVGQDVAVPIAFLVTEAVELVMACDREAQIRVSLKPVAGQADRAVLRIVSPALIASDALLSKLGQRYGRVMEGLSRQLRAPLDYDALLGEYAITVAILGRE